MCPLPALEENQKLAHLFMICSNIKQRQSGESIGIEGDPVIASEAKHPEAPGKDWIASSQGLLAMTNNEMESKGFR
jgi:hypothetical protein